MHKDREILNTENREALQHDSTSMTDMRETERGEGEEVFHNHSLSHKHPPLFSNRAYFIFSGKHNLKPFPFLYEGMRSCDSCAEGLGSCRAKVCYPLCAAVHLTGPTLRWRLTSTAYNQLKLFKTTFATELLKSWIRSEATDSVYVLFVFLLAASIFWVNGK